MKLSPTVPKMELRTGKALILASREFAQEKRSHSWYYLLSTLACLAMAMTGTVYNFHWAGQVVCSIIAGLLLVRFFVIYHDYQHKAILQNSKIAEFIMTTFGILILAPVKIWKRSHDHHHHNNSKLTRAGIGSYPLITKNEYLKLPKRDRLLYMTVRHPVTIFMGYISLFLFDFNIKTFLQSPARHWDSLLALVLHITIGATIFYFLGWLGFILSWLIPFVLNNGLGSYLFYAQHNFPSASFKEGKDWDYVSAALESTSFMKMSTIMNWFTGDIGYHHVHHINHRIPFYRLKEAMNAMPELQNPRTTSLSLKDIVSCLRLKFWDPEREMMEGY